MFSFGMATMKRYLFIICIPNFLNGVFDYDRAVHAAQKGQWALAGDQFKALVTAYPDKPDLLYDAGIAAYNNEDYEQAEALFDSAAQLNEAPRKLKEQAYFNKANTQVKQKRLKEALSSYDQVLMLNPENQEAQHNASVVKQMLKQQEQQKNEQKQQDKNRDQQDQKDKQQNQDQSSSDDKQDADQNDQNESQEKDQQQQGNKQNGSTTDQDTQKKNQDKQQGDDERLDQDGDQKDDESDRPKDQKQQPRQQQQRRRRNQPEKNTQKEKQAEQQEHDEHNTPLEKEQSQAQQQATQENNMPESEKEQGSQGLQAYPELDPALERVLARREDRDAQLNKQVIKALVGETAGQHGQNSW